MTNRTTALALASAITLLACSTSSSDARLAQAIAESLAAACPLGADPSDEVARDDCAAKLTDLVVLRRNMRDPILWGGQSPTSYSLDKGTSWMNARAWRRMYLSTFMFDRRHSVESVADDTVLHVPVMFRGAMPTGAYPYPFWHSDKKWASYSYSTTLHFIIRGGELIGALRGTEQDPTRPKTPHAWDGQWSWRDAAGTEMPYVSLYDYLLSKGNPHVRRLDDRYRALEAAMRAQNCQACHAPDNQDHASQLELLVYPNQALTARHDIVAQLSDDQMPPQNELGLPVGIPDAAAREHLLELARAFEAAGDEALAWEGDGPGAQAP